MRSVACGFRGIVRFAFAPFGVMPNSVIGVVPIAIAPRARTRATLVASFGCARGSMNAVPHREGMPRSAVCSFTAHGTPSSGPSARPSLRRSSTRG